MYDLTGDPLELTNLAYPTHTTPASVVERARLHRRLSDVMRDKGTIPDEIRWPEVDATGLQPRLLRRRPKARRRIE
jgi:hypothetical protein